MSKAKKTNRKTLSKAKKTIVRKSVKVTATASKAKTAVKRKVARKPRLTSLEDLQVQLITDREARRSVIPDSAARMDWSSTNKLNRSNKLPRKIAAKKPVYPKAHSE